MRLIWIAAGTLALGLGMIGVVLPLLPTVPFLLLAAFCFARSSDRLHDWLLAHPVLGPPIEDWRNNGVIRRRAKIIASASILATIGISLWLQVGSTVLAIQAVVLLAVTIFIWSRPET